jgi:hypothetical protein
MIPNIILRREYRQLNGDHAAEASNAKGRVMEGNRGDSLGTFAVWLSAVSALIYFLSSHAVKNHILFLFDNFAKALALK